MDEGLFVPVILVVVFDQCDHGDPDHVSALTLSQDIWSVNPELVLSTSRSLPSPYYLPLPSFPFFYSPAAVKLSSPPESSRNLIELSLWCFEWGMKLRGGLCLLYLPSWVLERVARRGLSSLANDFGIFQLDGFGLCRLASKKECFA